MEICARRMRINCVAAESVNDALRDYMCQRAETLLRRNEAVVNMAVVGNQLLVPHIQGARIESFPALRRYEAAIRLMSCL